MKIVILSLLISLAFAHLDVSINIVSKNPLELNFTVSNPQSNDQTFLQWGTPFEGVWTNMFEIRDAEFNRLDYIGMMVRRGEVPIEEEYITIPAGGMKSVIVNLGENYDFSSVGKYMVRVNLPMYSELKYSPNDAQVEVFHLETIPAKRLAAPQGYTNCNANQQSQIVTAITGALSECSRAVSCLSQENCPPYTEWFGTYTAAHWTHVDNIYRRVHARLNNRAQFNGYCNPSGCGSNVYGYVYPTDTTFTVYLCGAFWSVPNERVNTIVHEMSHFNSLGQTQDYAYGQSACRNLARSNPANAVRNADNIC